MFKNYVDEGEWDFRGSNTKEYTHCFHIYPAMMIPQIARKLIKLYGENASLLFDPYCGTGTSLVEGRLAGLNVVGTDLNPTARFISKSKIENYDVDLYALEMEMNKFLDNLEEELAGLTEDFSRFDEPRGVSFERLERWFPPRSISEVSFCLEKLNRIGLNATNKNFILVALSECLRLISYQRNNEFKLYRIPEEKTKLHDVPLYNLLKDRIDRNVKGVHDFMEKVISSTKSNVQAFNTVEYDGLELIGGNPDLVVTSPPYGDSATTVAYAQFSWMTNVWLGFDSRPPGALDRDLMGGRRTEITDFGFKPMDDAIAKISIEDAKRASEVMDFYSEYNESIENVAKVVAENGYVCYVVGNRRVKGIQLPTDQFTAWAFEKNGFEYICTHIREIPNKRMPSKNSPTNVSGKTGSTMEHEYIVVLRKMEADS